ncbi:cytochrome C [Streptomyces sp. AcH 505]|uniref:FxSxx-COOH system tetratricopeptide repeat protein n=1 Tax=Streptomyces sp. AcH 505 TaxID=352211 RepID=UPI000591B07F|nr:cytochrome C [Streptomyces sp. AcH 505]
MNGLPRERAPGPDDTGSSAVPGAAGDGPSWQDIADSLWLASRRLAAGRTAAPAPAVPEADADLPPAVPPAVPDSEPWDFSVPGSNGAVPGAPTHLTATAGTGGEAPGTYTAVSAGRTRPAARPLPLAKAMRRLGRRVDSRTLTELDETRTAEHGINDGLWIPYLLPTRENAFDLVLLVDDAPTMRGWERTARQLAVEAARSGSFRDVRSVSVSVPAAGPPVLRRPGGQQADPAELLDGRGSRLFLVVTDGLGAGWAGGAADTLLARLAAGGPTALVHLLPPYLRHRSSLYPFRASLEAAGFGALNRYLGCRPPHSLPDPVRPLPEPDDGTVPVPVLSLRPESFRAWADLVTGERGVSATLPVVLAGALAKGASAPGLRAPRIDGPRAASAAVRRFLGLASPLARQLALLLAVVPLDFDLIEELRDRAVPEAGPDHLAEVLMGGLINWNGQDGEGERAVDFADGVREALLATGTRTQLAQLVTLLSELRSGRGAGALLRAVLRDPEHAPLPDPAPANRPWLRIELAVLKALSGPYARRASRVAAELAGVPGASGVTRGGAGASPDKSGSLREGLGAEQTTDPPGGTVPPTPPETVVDENAGKADHTMDLRAQEHSFVRTGQPKVMGNVPPKNPNFTGRESLLAAVEQQLREDKTAAVLPHALHGMGGVGKSQIAIEYIYRHSHEYSVIWWIPAEHDSLILAALAELARSLGLDVGPQANTAVPAVREALRTGKPYENWLLVFDNAENIDAVRAYFPSGGSGKIIVTSRNREWERVATPLSVNVFERDESITLLQRRARGLGAEDADRLAEALGDLPLAIEQAGAWHAATGMPVAEYLELLAARRPEILELDPSPDYPVTVAAAWNISLERLAQNNPAARQLLEICAGMAPEPIPLSMLRGGHKVEITPELDPVLRDPLLLARATRDLSKLSLIKLDHKSGTLQMHRLMQNVLASGIASDEQERMRRAAHLLLSTAKPGSPESPEHWPAYQALLPHVIASEAVESSDPWVRGLVSDVVLFLYYWGAHDAGESLARQAWLAWSAQSGAEELQVVRMTKLLGFYLRVLGRGAEALTLNESALAISRTAQVPDEELIDSMCQMASALRYEGKFYEARALDEEADERARDLFGPEDPETLRAAHDYGISMRMCGEFAEARRLDEETAHQWELLLGPTNGLTLNTLNALAIDVREAGDYRAAHILQESTYQTYVTHFGEDNAATIRAARNLAVCRRRAGVLSQAGELTEATLLRFTTRYGTDYPDTLATAMNAIVDRRLGGDLAASRDVGEKTLARYRATLGDTHAYTLGTMVNFAATLRALGELDKAEALDREATERFRATLGERHVSTLTAAMGLANDHYARLDFARALEVDEATLGPLTRSAGPDHPLTLSCTANLALDLRGLGRVAEADELNAKAVEGLTRLLGDDHPRPTAARLYQRIECDIAPMPL